MHWLAGGIRLRIGQAGAPPATASRAGALRALPSGRTARLSIEHLHSGPEPPTVAALARQALVGRAQAA